MDGRTNNSAEPPPVKVTVLPAVTVGATWTSVTVLLPMLLMPLPELPSETTQSIVRPVSPPPFAGSPFAGVTLYVIDSSAVW